MVFRSFFMRAFEVDHAGHPAIGYLIGSRTASGLKKEYQKLDAASLRDLVKSGITIKSDPIEKIEIAYTGDTCARGLMKQSTEKEGGGSVGDATSLSLATQKSSLIIEQILQAELILCELTFLDSTEDECKRQMAEERGHIHICDIEKIFLYKQCDDASTSGSEKIISSRNAEEGSRACILSRQSKNSVFYHLSGRYGPATRALDLIAEELPHQLRYRCQVAISSVLSREENSSKDSLSKLVQSNGCISLAAYLAWKHRMPV